MFSEPIDATKMNEMCMQHLVFVVKQSPMYLELEKKYNALREDYNEKTVLLRLLMNQNRDLLAKLNAQPTHTPTQSVKQEVNVVTDDFTEVIIPAVENIVYSIESDTDEIDTVEIKQETVELSNDFAKIQLSQPNEAISEVVSEAVEEEEEEDTSEAVEEEEEAEEVISEAEEVEEEVINEVEEEVVEEEEEVVEEEEEVVEEEEEEVAEEEDASEAISEAAEEEVEEVVDEDTSEAVEEVAEEEEEEGVYEILIKGKRFYTTNETNGLIFSILPDDDVGDEIGKFVNSKPVWNK